MKDYTGTVFGKLTVVGEASRNGANRRVVVKCSCGSNQKEVLLGHLKNSHTTSCGCFHRSVIRKLFTSHGKSSSTLYGIWANIKSRCFNKNNPKYMDYGGRGIDMLEGWKLNPEEFILFCEESGWKRGLEVDRLDNNKGYYPDNIRFVSRTVNVNNVRLLKLNNTSGYRGVYLHSSSRKFVAKCNFKNFIKLTKGGFRTALEAAICRDNFIRKHNISTPINLPIRWGIYETS